VTTWKEGDRVMLVSTTDEYTPLRPGVAGTVELVTEAFGHPQIWVVWDDGSKLAMLPDDGDVIETAPEEEGK
jgi:Domain of unknown function (DUF4314)